jgi:hypothetical protein
MASALACSISRAERIQPPAETPLRLPLMGMETLTLALRISFRETSGL